MRLKPAYAVGEREGSLLDDSLPEGSLLEALLPGDGAWEVELGYGKGRYLLERALANPERRFFGVEMVSKYFRMLSTRARRHGAANLLNVRGEALYLLSSVLPRAFADRLHVYFPDPWPKARHHRRRLFDPQTVDLVLGVVKPGGELCFATDHLEYGEVVMEILDGYPGLTVEPVLGEWPDGARTNYEAKYIVEGRPILRAVARVADDAVPGALHPGGAGGVLAAWAEPPADGS
ncbi:MAG: hypothetical protein AAGF23_08785 [Acidobacteriota bacterium]